MRPYRAILVGAFLAALINVWETFSYYIVHSSWMRFGYVPVAVMLPFVLLALPVNVLLRRVKASWALEPWELVIVFCMAMIAAIFPTLGILGFLISFTASLTYFASPENQWEECFGRHVPSWIVPRDDGNAIRWLFEGLPVGESIPWDAWVVPLFWWSLLIGAVFVTCFCTMVILRRQWAEHERINYPLATLPLMLADAPPEGRLLPNVARNWLFWAGFAVPFFIISWNMVSYFCPGFPVIPIGKWHRLRLARWMPSLLLKVNFFVMAFAFFTPLDVLLGVWVCQVLSVVEAGVFNRIGYNIGRPDNWCSFNVSVGWQGFGAFLFFVITGAWLARRHLREVINTALGRPGGVDDRNEILSYRAALTGTLLGSAFILVWFLRAGMSLRVACLFFFMTYIVYVGVTKLVAQTGFVYLWAPLTPHSVTFHTLGSATMTPNDWTMIGMAYCLGCNCERLIPCTGAHIARLADGFAAFRRRFFWAAVIAFFVSLAAGLTYTLYLCYTHGASNSNAFEFRSGNHWIFGVIANKVRNPKPTDWARILWLGVGGGLMALATVVYYNVPWWPMHPVGVALAGVETTTYIFFSVFLAWVIKFTVVRLGGGSAYSRAQVFFVGIMVGYVLGVGVSFGVDCIWFMGSGHIIHLW